jgi:hypothetical protein
VEQHKYCQLVELQELYKLEESHKHQMKAKLEEPCKW